MSKEGPNGKPLRAVGYCRTSGEGQRDNTSIPNQQSAIKEHCSCEGFDFVSFYVDECKTGSKIAGRDEFQRLMRDAANGRFDIVVVFDITRFARDGFDILDSSRTLKRDFGINVVDTKGQYDTRNPRNTLLNFVHAGVSEHERLNIMERMIGARIQRAKQGLCWMREAPFGRAWTRTSKNTGEWDISERGHKIRELLERYVAGESLTVLAPEYGFCNAGHVISKVHAAYLGSTYHATFNCPDLGIENMKVAVPAMPRVISPELEQRVLARLSHNRNWNRNDLKSYVLGGFIYCGECGHALHGVSDSRNDRAYYRHAGGSRAAHRCNLSSVRTDATEGAILDYLYGWFVDEPSFNAAVQAAAPSADGRKKTKTELTKAGKDLAKTQKEIKNLVMAVAGGADLAMLLGNSLAV